jgi:general secretion pathway protein D
MTPVSHGSAVAYCWLAGSLLLAGCQSVRPASIDRLPEPAPLVGTMPRTDAVIPASTPRPIFEDRGVAQRQASVPASAGQDGEPGEVTLKFADTDIREIVRVILGGTLKLNYTIDPAVRGTATLDTPVPLRRSELLPTLELLLNQNGATLARRGGLYSVVPLGSAKAARVVSGVQIPGSGSQVVPLRYAGAKELAKLFEPYVVEGSALVADPSRNALIISGDPTARETLLSLVRAFDVDALAGQSFAILPTGNADPEKMSAALEKTLRAANAGPLSAILFTLRSGWRW